MLVPMREISDARKAERDERAEAYTAIGTGAGIGAFGIASAALLGSVCPACVVAAPALIAYGVYRRVQCARRARSSCDNAPRDSGALAPNSPEESPP
jgi:hypothetical protein